MLYICQFYLTKAVKKKSNDWKCMQFGGSKEGSITFKGSSTSHCFSRASLSYFTILNLYTQTGNFKKPLVGPFLGLMAQPGIISMSSPNSCSCSSRGEFFKTKIKSRHLLLYKSLRSLHFSYCGCKISHNLAPAASSLHVISASTHGPSFRYQTHPAFLQSGILYTNSSLYGTHFSHFIANCAHTKNLS